MSDLIQIKKKSLISTTPAKGDLRYGSTAKPNNRAPYAKAVIAVTSGKGGVGKSTVTVNLAVALAQRGLRVGLLDADVYGPSCPRLLGVNEEQLEWNDTNQMIPAENFGVKLVSTGLTSPDDDTPFAWRSSVASSALVQLLEDVAWGELDVLIVDMPPGTGDVQLTMAQELPLCCAVVVTTPQTVATDDVRRAIRLNQEIAVPVALIENMSFFVAPDTGAVYHPFGQGGGRILAERYNLPLLGELPLDISVREAADAGRPIMAIGTDAQRAAYAAIAEGLLAMPALRDKLAGPTETTSTAAE